MKPLFKYKINIILLTKIPFQRQLNHSGRVNPHLGEETPSQMHIHFITGFNKIRLYVFSFRRLTDFSFWFWFDSIFYIIVGEPEIQKLEKSGRKVAEF